METSYSAREPLRRCGLPVFVGRSHFGESALKCGSRISVSELLQNVLLGPPEWSAGGSPKTAVFKECVD